MGMRLLPLSVGELSTVALELERDAALRFREYARRVRELGSEPVAAAFEAMARDEDLEVADLAAVSGGHQPCAPSSWEYACQLEYMPDRMEHRPRLVPLSVQEALHLALLARRRAEAFYRDVAAHAREALVRAAAAEMLLRERRQLLRLESLLEDENRAEQARGPRTGGGARAP